MRTSPQGSSIDRMLTHSLHTRLFSIAVLAGFLFPGCLFDSDDDETGVWMSIAPIQCGGNAWEQANQTIDVYLDDRGVEVLDTETSIFAEVVCEACSCISGQRVDVLVSESDVETMLAEGFVRDEDWPY